MNHGEVYFLIIEGLIILFWIVNGIAALFNSKKMDDLLREKYIHRWLENHGGNNPFNRSLEGRGYLWGKKDNEIQDIYKMKIKIRLGAILAILSPFVLTLLNIFVFIHFGFLH